MPSASDHDATMRAWAEMRKHAIVKALHVVFQSVFSDASKELDAPSVSYVELFTAELARHGYVVKPDPKAHDRQMALDAQKEGAQ